MKHARTIAMATTLLADGRADDVVAMVEPLLDSVTAPAANTGQLLLRGLLARVEGTHRDRPERALELLPRTDDVSDACTCVRAEVALWRGWARARRAPRMDEASRALRLLKESQELFVSICDPGGRCWALLGQAQAYAALEEYGLMRRMLDDAEGLSSRLQDTQAERWLHELSISALRCADEYERAAEHLTALQSIADSWSDRRVDAHAAAHTAALRHDREAEPAAVLDAADKALSRLRPSTAAALPAVLRAVDARTRALCRQGAWDRALEGIDDIESSLSEEKTAGAFLQMLRARVALRRGEPERAHALLDATFDESLPSLPGIPRSRIALLYGAIFDAQNRPEQARRWQRRAHRIAQESGHHSNQRRAAQALPTRTESPPEVSPTDPLMLVDGLVAESREMQAVAETIRQVQPSHSPVLVTGEGGTGKRLVARALHATSTRANGPLETISCDPTQAGESLETRLFGDDRTEAPRSGALQAADGGTLIVEDVDALPQPLQSLLLDVLDTGRLAARSDFHKPVDVRVIATTTADLDARVQEDRFRRALRDRLRVISLHVPPLRERRPDIPLLARYFLDQLRPTDSALVSITQPAMEALLRYNWPGNVRQLRNEIERALVHVQSEPAPTIGLDILSDAIVEGARKSRSPQTAQENPDAILEPDQTLSDVLSRTEKAVIERVLGACDGQVTASADVLGLTRQGLYKKMKRLDIDASSFQSSSEPTPTA